MRRRYAWIVGMVAVLALGAAEWRLRGPRAAGPMPQSVYVWQRAWGPGTVSSVERHGGEFAAVLVLAAEVSGKDWKPSVARPPVDYAALAATRRPVGLAVRIGGLVVGGAKDGWTEKALADLTRGIVRDARAEGCEPAEVQIDYDCATSKLPAYRGWVRAVRAAIAPTPLTITALPAWLGSAEFAPLVRETDGFVLQVHALERPRLEDPEARLCDSRRAAAWVERAAGAGVPFRVALPTYGYLVVYDERGELKQVVAEADSPEPPPGWRARELRAEPPAMAGLVRRWSADRPALMRGVVWFRMPVEGDERNWAWPTLAAVMRGEAPAARLGVRVTAPGPGLREVRLVNEGDADTRLPSGVRVRWAGARPVALDALGGLDAAEPGEGEARFTVPASMALERISAGESRAVGWVRLVTDTEVHGDVVP